MTPAKFAEIRRDPMKWFHRHGYWRNEETRKATRGPSNVLQRRVFAHYRYCQENKLPCRIVVVKYRRAGSSTSGTTLVYLHSQNYESRGGVIGTDYKASSNMLDMVLHFAKHDDFPGWTADVKAGAMTKVSAEEYFGDGFDIAPLEERVDKIIATKLTFGHGSTVELYTSKNPESARSAGLNCYLATECSRWKSGGVQDAGETLMSMRNALPKKGFHFAMEESTANGAQGVFYETCRTARWPAYATWWKQWQTCWPLTEVTYGADLQFTLIFAAWFEDERHVPDKPLTKHQIEHLKSTLDADEEELIALYQQDGPKGPRLGGEVNATLWDQLAWRRGIIATVCTKRGADEFKQEYASNPLEAFRASGSPALDQNGLTELDRMSRTAEPEYGVISRQQNGRVTWERVPQPQSMFTRWEAPIVGCKYLISVDCMTGAEAIHGTGEKDRHAVFVFRDAYVDSRGVYHRLKVVARINPPCQWETHILAKYVDMLSIFYGKATVAAEANAGVALITKLADEYHTNLYLREVFDSTTQRTTPKLGWWTDEGSRRILIDNLQHAVREQSMELLCPHAIGECKALVINTKGKVLAGGSGHDDDPLSISIGLTCMHAATAYQGEIVKAPEAADARKWKLV